MTQVFWGDTHLNVHDPDANRFEQAFAEGERHLDFLMIAYYPADYYTTPEGLAVESKGASPESSGNWRLIKQLVRKYHKPGEFVTFAGYEWTGDRTRWGDVNVFHFGDDGELDLSESLGELHEHFRGRKVLVIPHHTGYLPGQRGKDWSCHDETLSPVTEIYSNHGSSEGCRTPRPLHANTSMGPRTSGGTAQDALARGLKLGFIASSDAHDCFPGVWGTGLAAVRANGLSREGIWDAFFKRRVYAVTGDRILLDFTINDCPMGGELQADGKLTITADVTGSDALDRIELIRDGRVLATHCHADTWPVIPEEDPVRLKVRVECGWGPKPAKGFPQEEKEWAGRLSVPQGAILSVEGCFTRPGQRIGRTTERECEWRLVTHNADPPPVPGMGSRGNQAVVFELEMPRRASATLAVEDIDIALRPDEILHSGRLFPLIEQARRDTQKHFGLAPDDVENRDVFFHNAWKMKLHRAAPEASYRARHVFEDVPPPGEHYYYLRVSQLNGQLAWSSPIWITTR